MKLGEKLYKWVSYAFIVFIVILIVLTFGMPSFMGSAADADRYIAARVGSEVITRKEVQNMKSYMMRLPQFQAFASQESFLNKYALDYLISEKLQMIMQKESGIYPLDDAKNSIIAQYLKENFKEFQSNEGFDFERFNKEFLKPRRINFSAIEEQALRSTVYDFKGILDSFDLASKMQVEDVYRLNNTKISYEILVFSPDERKNILKKLIGITEKDIQERFQKEYLSKNKNDQLTPLKKEAITQAIINDKRAKYEKEWLNTITEDLKSNDLRAVSRKHGGTIIELPDVALTDSISQKNTNKKINLVALENSPEFFSALKSKQIKKAVGPWNIEDSLYCMKITNIVKPETEGAVTADLEKDIKSENRNSADQMLDSILRDKIKIVRSAYKD